MSSFLCDGFAVGWAVVYDVGVSLLGLGVGYFGCLVYCGLWLVDRGVGLGEARLVYEFLGCQSVGVFYPLWAFLWEVYGFGF